LRAITIQGQSNVRITDLGEFALIDRLRTLFGEAAPAAGSVSLAIGDDAAVLSTGGRRELVATADMLVEQVHFRRDWTSAADLGWKALAVNVSDVGAMGAAPLAALVCAALPAAIDVGWIEALYGGLKACGEVYGCPVVGGDTVRSPGPVSLSVAALGSVERGRAVRRDGAKPGDLLCTTGTLGDSAAGLALLLAGRTRGASPKYAALFEAHLRPRPPVRAGAALADDGVTAMLDLSDGLASDTARLSAASGAGVRMQEERLPISLAARRAAEELGVEPADWAVRGGEDYELMFTIPPERFDNVPELLAPLGVTATIIGSVTEGGSVLVRMEGREEPMPPPGFSHFSER